MSNLREYRLDELYEMGSGISTSKDQAGHGAPFVSFSDIFNNPILPDELTQKMDTSAEEQEQYSVKKGDVFLTRTSEVLDELAMSSVAVKDYPNATFSGFAKRLRPIQTDVTYDKFMAFFLRSDYFRKIINTKAVMTLRASFNEEIFSYIKIMLPDYDHQVKCGDLFYDIEQKIRTNLKINAELEDMAKTLYNYWFIQFEFPNENGKPYKASGGKMIWNEELKREIPVGWTAKPIVKTCDIISGFPFQSTSYTTVGKYRLITIKNVQDDGINLDVDNFVDVLPEGMPDCCILSKGDILMSLTGNVGRVGLMYSDNCLLNQRVALIRPKLPYLKPFLYCMFRSKHTRTIMEHISTGTSQKNLSPVDTGKLKIAYDERTIKLFCEKMDSTLNKMVLNKFENQELASLRDFLLPLLMNGQVGFKEVAE